MLLEVGFDNHPIAAVGVHNGGFHRVGPDIDLAAARQILQKVCAVLFGGQEGGRCGQHAQLFEPVAVLEDAGADAFDFGGHGEDRKRLAAFKRNVANALHVSRAVDRLEPRAIGERAGGDAVGRRLFRQIDLQQAGAVGKRAGADERGVVVCAVFKNDLLQLGRFAERNVVELAAARDADRFQSRAVKRPAADLVQRRGQIDVLQRVASCKRIIADPFKLVAGKLHLRQIPAVLEAALAEAEKAFRQRDFRQTRAARECALTDGCDRFGDVDRFQRAHIDERFEADRFKGVGQMDRLHFGFNIGAELEVVKEDRLDGHAVNLGGDRELGHAFHGFLGVKQAQHGAVLRPGFGFRIKDVDHVVDGFGFKRFCRGEQAARAKRKREGEQEQNSFFHDDIFLSYFVFHLYMSEFAKAYSIFCFSCKNFFHRQASFRFDSHLYMPEIAKPYKKAKSFFEKKPTAV